VTTTDRRPWTAEDEALEAPFLSDFAELTTLKKTGTPGQAAKRRALYTEGVEVQDGRHLLCSIYNDDGALSVEAFEPDALMDYSLIVSCDEAGCEPSALSDDAAAYLIAERVCEGLTLVPQAHGAGDRLIFAPNRTADVLVIDDNSEGDDLESLLLAVNKQPREAPTFDGTTDEGYAVTLMEEAEGFRVRAMDPLRPWRAVERVFSLAVLEQAKYVPVTSHLTDSDKEVLGEALLKSVLAPADEEKPLEVHLTAPPADLRPGSPQRTSRALLTLGVELDGQLVMASLYEKRRLIEVQAFHAESGLACTLEVREKVWMKHGLKALKELSAEEKDRVCHAITESIALEEPLPPADLTAALRDDAFASALQKRAAAAPA
jgi:hypothetical protein